MDIYSSLENRHFPLQLIFLTITLHTDFTLITLVMYSPAGSYIAILVCCHVFINCFSLTGPIA